MDFDTTSASKRRAFTVSNGTAIFFRDCADPLAFIRRG
jgi:hypothetical protein